MLSKYFRKIVKSLTKNEARFVCFKLVEWGFIELRVGMSHRLTVGNSPSLVDLTKAFERVSSCAMYYCYPDGELPKERPDYATNIQDPTAYMGFYMCLGEYHRRGFIDHVVKMIENKEHMSTDEELDDYVREYRHKLGFAHDARTVNN